MKVVLELIHSICVHAPSLQSCPTLCNPMDCSPPDSPDKNTRVDCHSLLQGIFPTQVSNSSLLHCRWILYRRATGEGPHSIQMGSYNMALCIWLLSLSSVFSRGIFISTAVLYAIIGTDHKLFIHFLAYTNTYYNQKPAS